jgi:long-chain acyl-CoA synthetase
MTSSKNTKRTRLYDDADGKFIHDVVLASCRGRGEKTAIIDTSCTPARRITFAEYGELVEQAGRGLVANGIKPGERIGIFLPNSWEFGVAFHAAMMAGAVPTTMNPTYREREVRYQLETCDAVALVTDGAVLGCISLAGLPELRNVFTTIRVAATAALRNFHPEPRSRSTAEAGYASLLQRHHRFA